VVSFLVCLIPIIDSYRAWNNGTLCFGAVESPGAIAWAERNTGHASWSINLTAISAGNRTNPPVTTWSATVSTEDLSLTWPQQLLDWYFKGINFTWSPSDNTYRYPYNKTLPNVIYTLGNGTFTIPGSHMPYQRDKNSLTCIPIVTGDNSTEWDHEYAFGLWWTQLGLLILDYQNSRVGFAKKSTQLPAFETASLEIVPFN
jgi:hypothetical protein